ncbi:MAG: pyridoxal-dependent decarboxylase [Gammaproteobacteria bacterium]|nr:pyridoxal-dependent decarboxylase [Gammaproteobacteria bacterium]
MAKLSLDNSSLESMFSKLEQSLDDDIDHPIDASAWFLGPRAENAEALLEFVKLAASRQIEARKKYMPEDPSMVDDYKDKDHQDSISVIRTKLTRMLDLLQGSIPLASYRNQSHMYWDITLPGAVGYFAAMLYNQNNVAAEASPVTTMLEIKVGEALCKMLGFDQACENAHKEALQPWGHITCDGSVANGESMWAARNLKFLPVALAAAIAVEKKLKGASCVSVTTCQGKRGRLIDLSLWELLNLPIDEVIGLVQTIQREGGIDEKTVNDAVDAYSVQNLGLVQFQQRFLDSYRQATPVVFVPATAHYSWPKTAALLGLGTAAVKPIEVDLEGRMDVLKLRKALCKCLKHGRPVLQVVAVMGSTEEGAIDPLADIVALREEFQGLGLNFVIHVDGAWGGYFTSMLRSDSLGADLAADIDSHPALYLSEHFTAHFAVMHEVDSVTLDPHKSGFIPYPAGGLCYRNGDMRNLIAFTAPVVTHGGVDPTVGPYGIEGSKPGAAAASVYLSNKVIPLNQNGYGRLLGRCLFNSKRFYAALVTMDLDNERKAKGDEVRIHVTPFQRLPIEREGGSKEQILQQKKAIAETIVPHQTDYLIGTVFGLPNPNKEQAKSLKLFQEIGSDLSIVTYAFNFSVGNKLNRDLELMNKLNHEIFRKLSLQPNETGKIPTTEMFITASNFDPKHYGKTLVHSFAKRAGVVPKKDVAINFLISTTQNPWLSTTADGNVMIPKLIEILRASAHKIAVDIVREHHLD